MSGKDGMETLAEIVAEMRTPEFARCVAAMTDAGVVMLYLDAVADRIEAAAKRDGEMLKANIARVRELEGLLGGAADALLEAAIRRREGRTGTPRQDSDGNVAALRESLEFAAARALEAEEYLLRSANTKACMEQLRKDASAALAAPARVCDRIQDRHVALYRCRDWLERKEERSEDFNEGVRQAIAWAYYDGEDRTVWEEAGK